MTSLKKQMAASVLAIASFVALGSAAAFTYGASRRVHPQPPAGPTVQGGVQGGVQGSSSARSSSVATAASELTEIIDADRVLYVPPIIIVAPWPQRAATVSARTPLAAFARDLSGMARTEARSLDMGSGRVRVSE